MTCVDQEVDGAGLLFRSGPVSKAACLEWAENAGGAKLVPVLKDPAATVKQAAIGRYTSGDTIRTTRHRFSLLVSRDSADTCERDELKPEAPP